MRTLGLENAAIKDFLSNPRTLMNANKLDALKQKYAGTKGGDIFHPPFAAVAAQGFSNADQRKWPFAGAATFLGLPYRPGSAAAPNFRGLDVAGGRVAVDLWWPTWRRVALGGG